MNIEAKICDIAHNEYLYFLNKANVIGVGLGKKVCRGVETLTTCIKVFVSKKIPNIMLMEYDKIPTMYNGIPTDVVESGILESAMLTNRVRPVTGGYCIGPAYFSEYSGSYGCLVKDDKNFYMLSCNHVIAAENQAPIGTPILQPSILFGGSGPGDIVARLSKFIELRFVTPTEEPVNSVDCAIARVRDLSLVSNEITFFGALHGIIIPYVGAHVKKVGYKTERTLGTVLAINVTAQLEYGSQKIIFRDLIFTGPMVLTGDSGSVLIDDRNNVMGLTIAGGPKASAYNPIIDVLSILNVTLA